MSLLQGAMDGSAMGDFGISWSYSLTFTSVPAKAFACICVTIF